MEEMFESASRSAGDLAGVFEFDGETGYFYLYDTRAPDNTKVVNSIRMLAGLPDFSEMDVLIKWDCDERRVGLFIRDELWAAFDSISGAKFGGGYRTNSAPDIPTDVASSFLGGTREGEKRNHDG
jgi:hypothetical protein